MPSLRHHASSWATADASQPVLSWRQLFVIGLSTMLLVLFSAGVFSVLEHGPAREARRDYDESLAALLVQGDFSADQSMIVDQIITLHGQHWCRSHMVRADPWNFWSAFYFTMVLISTVGYGDLAPETGIGKAAAVIISLVGIPLLLSFYLPLSRWFVDSLTGRVRRMYISRAVERAMEAVQITTTRGDDDSLVSTPRTISHYARRLPDSNGVGLSQKDVWRVELASLLLILMMLLAAILGLAPCLSAYQNWPLGDSFVFIWYTLTTIGLGDVTLEPRHPVVASTVLLLLLFIGASAGRALICCVQRLASFLEQNIREAPVITEALDRLTSSRTGTAAAEDRELNHAAAEDLVSGQDRTDAASDASST